MLQYHAKALQLLSAVPQIDPKAATEISTIEARIQRPLPPSVREWYSLEGACDLLTRYSNGDPAVPTTELGRNPLIAQDFLIFRNENQGVCTWAIWLNGSDDPPVFVDYDTAFKTYQPCANTFSDYVYTCLWDYALVLRHGTPVIQAQNHPLSDEALIFLRKNFNAELQTDGWPGNVQYRFHSRGQRILIWSSNDQADWWLVADTNDALSDLVKILQGIDELGKSLWSNDAVANSILERTRTR